MKIQLLQTEGMIKKRIGKAFYTKYAGEIFDIVYQSKKEIDNIIINQLRRSAEYQSITGLDGIGTLRGEFGLDDYQVSLFQNNLDKLFSSYAIQYEPIYSIKKGLELDTAISIETEPVVELFTFITEKGDVIPWMDWLLHAGTAELVSDYYVYTKPGYGRSKLAVMLQTDGASFSVNSRFAGSPSDNWVTRVLSNSKRYIKEVLINNVKKY